MKKYRGYVSTKKVGSDCYFEFEVEDNATETEIQDMAIQCVWDELEFNYEEIKNA